MLLSDHGKQTAATGDSSPGEHSWRAVIASQGIEEELADDLLDVRAFLETVDSDDTVVDSERVEMDTPTETLRDLGYIS